MSIVRVHLLFLFVTLLILGGAASNLHAQDRCGTVEYQKKLISSGAVESTYDFEPWIRDRLKSVSGKSKSNARTNNSTYKIPVVVHIIHNGENHATNISDEQVLSQLRVLNEDYNRENADASETPDIFADVAGNPGIEFVLAKQTPEGLPTNGIIRVQGPKSSWTVNDNYLIKSLSYWPAEDYLNIWVCNLTDFLGYAQFPQSDLLDGLENSSSNRLTDGVVIATTVFGSIDDGDFILQNSYNKGRTATHEIGHFFGLRHIWGDDDGACGGHGDYVDDTPDQADRTLNCPSHPRTTCSTTSMFQNFLDYTNDECMNLFTVGQAERMAVVIENSPRRKSLLTSHALEDPQPIANDIGIRSISSPAVGECAGNIVPAIEVRNYGNNTITTAEIRILKDGTPAETKVFALNLSELESAELEFSPIALSPGTTNFTFEVVSTNGNPDGAAFNNTLDRSVFVPETASTPVLEQFGSFPDHWQLFNPDGLYTWDIVPAVNGEAGNTAMKLDFYDYEDNEGEIDILLSPVIDLTNTPAALVLFDVAHAQYQNSKDGLKVVVLSNCNADVTQGQVIYEKYGSDLSTAGKMNEAFTPQAAAQWRTEVLNLENFIGTGGVQLAFVAVNNWGNNLYLDNIRILTEDFANVSLRRIVAPPPVVCSPTLNPVVVVRNSGTTINSLEVEYTLNGTTQVHSVTGITIDSGSEAEIQLPPVTLAAGSNTFAVNLINPGGQPDLDTRDNEGSRTVVFDNKTILVPFKENFEQEFASKWTNTSPTGGVAWIPQSFSGNRTVAYKAFDNTNTEEEAWLVTSAFDLSETNVASIFFDISYALRNGVSEIFEVRASTGCTQPFETIRTLSGDALSVTTASQPWEPKSDSDWNRDIYVSLSDLAGQENVRLAFVVSNRNGNNLYMDNLRLYLSDDQTPVTVNGVFNVYPNPVRPGEMLQVSFNFETLNDIVIEVIDSMGKQIFQGIDNGVLNQTLSLDTSGLAPGLYVVRIMAAGKVYNSKVLIGY